ncbi:hypothetical protein MLD38_000973 [Melastoma candidum]|uniref:Uncharacterized protein n=1 Tax=Melastoma candidum TaxID=119954 RepID=A0ACB9SBV1_9MYRT|nr:hypothetical protein MLD38_000973 [Melastoma candidum]
MWMEALDLILGKLLESKMDFSKVATGSSMAVFIGREEVARSRPHWTLAIAPNLEKKTEKLDAYICCGGNHFFLLCAEQGLLSHSVSGDNPNSLAGLLLNKPRDLAISLGASDSASCN